MFPAKRSQISELLIIDIAERDHYLVDLFLSANLWQRPVRMINTQTVDHLIAFQFIIIYKRDRQVIPFGVIAKFPKKHLSAVTGTMTFAAAAKPTTWFWSTGAAWGTIRQRPTRKGIEVPREPRTVRILALHRTGWDGRDLSLEVRCSKGTYVRTLVEDISAALGTVGHVIALRRTQLGPFRDERMWSLEELEALAGRDGEEALGAALHPPDVAVRHWPEVELGEAEQAYVLQGQAVFASGPGGARVRMYGPERRFLGVGQMSPEGRRVAPVRIMLDLAAGGDTLKPLEAGDSRG